MESKHKVFWSDESKSDLEDIFDFYSSYSLQYAENLIESLLSRESQLTTYPSSGTYQNFEVLNQKYRYLVEGKFKIIYHIREEEQLVYVNTVFDTRQSPSTLRLD